ncbi:MAG: hypothetical protein ACYS8L_05600 [Planctomycetota bacterium]
MSEPSDLARELAPLVGEEVIVDVRGRHVYIGVLKEIGNEILVLDVLVLDGADVHFCDDSQTTSELYLLETKKNGIRPNRRKVYVMRSEILSVSGLDDVVVY